MRKNVRDVTSEIDFADAEFKSCELYNEYLLVIVTAWDEQEIQLKFKDAIQFSYKLGGTISSVIEYIKSTSFLQEALKLIYDKVPLDHCYIEFQILDTNDLPFIQVVAESLEIVKV